MKMLILQVAVSFGLGFLVGPFGWALVGAGYRKFRTWYLNRMIGGMFR